MTAKLSILLLLLASLFVVPALHAQANLQLIASTGIVDLSQTPAGQDVNTNRSVQGAALSAPATISLQNTFGSGSAGAAASGQAGLLQCQSTAGYDYVEQSTIRGGYSSTEAKATFADFLTVHSSTLPPDTVVVLSLTLTLHGTGSGPLGNTGGRAEADLLGSLLAESSIGSFYKTLSFADGRLGQTNGQVKAKVGETFRLVYILDSLTYLTSDVKDYRLLTSDGASAGFGLTVSVTPQDPNVSFTAASGYGYGSTSATPAGNIAPAPQVTETDTELAAALDADGDGRLDYLIIDKATGVRQLGFQQSDGSFAWADPAPTGVDRVTGLGIGRFGGPADGFALASPTWNRVTLFSNPNGDPLLVPSVGIGPSLVVGLNFGGDTNDDLAIGTIWDKGAVLTHLSGLVGSSNGFSPAFGPQEETGALSRGNRAQLTPGGGALAGALRDQGGDSASNKDFVLRSLSSSAPDGPTLPGLPPETEWAWGQFQTNDLPRFLFYQPGNSNLLVPALQGSTPGPFSWSGGTNYPFALPISGIIVVPTDASALLLVLFDDGNSAGTYDFDGKSAPVLRQTMTAPAGAKFSTAGALANGDFLLLNGANGGSGNSSGWQRWSRNGSKHQMTASGSFPPITTSHTRANILLYGADPNAVPDTPLLRLLHVGEWSVAANITGTSIQVSQEHLTSLGLGAPASLTANLPSALPSLLFPVVNQRTSAESVALLAPPALPPAGDLNFSPAPGSYHVGGAGYLEVDITAPASPPIYYRNDTRQSWVPYDPSNPPRISASTSFLAFADTTPPGRIESAAYTITAASGVTPPSSIDANHNGLPDDWEQTFGVSDPNADPDGDGFTNLQEYLAGTDPLDPASVPGSGSENVTLIARFPGLSAPANAICEIAWPSSATGYQLESTTDLGSAWTAIPTGVVAVGTEQIYYNLPTAGGLRAFFRLRRQP